MIIKIDKLKSDFKLNIDALRTHIFRCIWYELLIAVYKVLWYVQTFGGVWLEKAPGWCQVELLWLHSGLVGEETGRHFLNASVLLSLELSPLLEPLGGPSSVNDVTPIEPKKSSILLKIGQKLVIGPKHHVDWICKRIESPGGIVSVFDLATAQPVNCGLCEAP